MEYGPSGPTAVKDIDGSAVGISNEAAAFIGANASPFTNPRDFPCPAKVPDPRNTMNTETMFLWGHFDIPTVAVGTSGEQLITTSADPLAPVPIKWATGSDDSTATWCTPNFLARQYEANGMSDLVYKMRELGARSKSYRVVGHGLKVWVSRNTNLSRGNLEAGQFEPAASSNTSQPDGLSAYRGFYLSQWGQSNCFNSPTYGYQTTALTTGNIYRLRQCIESSKDQELGFLAADEGATVRWTDTNQFAFNPTKDRGVVMCHNMGFPAGTALCHTSYEAIDYSALGGLPTGFVAGTSTMFHPTFKSENLNTNTWNVAVPATSNQYLDLNKLGTYASYGYDSGFYGVPNTAPATTASTFMYYNASGEKLGSTAASDLTPYLNYVQSADLQFNRGLYVDCSGLDTTQILTVQVCWHIEYVPRTIEPWTAQPSPVDMSFDNLSALVRDRRAFPIVVKGHSFFSSLRKAFSKAANAFGKIFATVAPLAQSALASVPDPRAQAAAVGIGAAGGLIQAFSRKRIAMDEAVD